MASHKDSFKFVVARRQTQQTFNEVIWHHEVWFSGNVPKHVFILWLACLDSLSTKSKLASWGVIDCRVCPLCVHCVRYLMRLGIISFFDALIVLTFEGWLLRG